MTALVAALLYCLVLIMPGPITPHTGEIRGAALAVIALLFVIALNIPEAP